MAARGVSFRELARRTGFSPPTLNQYATGRRPPPSDKTIALLARALEEPAEVFYEWRRRRVLERVGDEPELVERLWLQVQR